MRLGTVQVVITMR